MTKEGGGVEVVGVRTGTGMTGTVAVAGVGVWAREGDPTAMMAPAEGVTGMGRDEEGGDGGGGRALGGRGLPATIS